jgi:hypothetical protein
MQQQGDRKRSAEDAAGPAKSNKKNKKTQDWLDQVIEKNSKNQEVYNAAAGEVKRQYLEIDKAKSGKEDDELDAALDMYHRALRKVQICQAVDALLRFMKMYASGLTCVAHIKFGAEETQHHIFRKLITRKSDDIEIEAYIDSLMERTTLNLFLDNVKLCQAIGVSVRIFDDRTFVDFFPPKSRDKDEIRDCSRKRLSCKNENYFPFFAAGENKGCRDIFLIANSLKV